MAGDQKKCEQVEKEQCSTNTRMECHTQYEVVVETIPRRECKQVNQQVCGKIPHKECKVSSPVFFSS